MPTLRHAPCNLPAALFGGFLLSERQFLVDEVTDWRVNTYHGSPEYRILWGSGAESWEPMAGCAGCAKAVASFLATITGPPRLEYDPTVAEPSL